MRALYCIALALLFTPTAPAADYPCRILRVIDGDTLSAEVRQVITLFDGARAVIGVERRIRLAGVNAPELHASAACERVAAVQAREFVGALVRGREERCVLRLGQAQHDKYGRLLGAVSIDGTDIAGALIASGQGREYAGGKRGAWLCAVSSD